MFFFGNFPGCNLLCSFVFHFTHFISFYFTLFCWPSCIVFILLLLVQCIANAKRDGTHAEARIGLSAKRMSPFKSARASVQSTPGSRGVRISCSNGSNSGYTMFRGSVEGTGYLCIC